MGAILQDAFFHEAEPFVYLPRGIADHDTQFELLHRGFGEQPVKHLCKQRSPVTAARRRGRDASQIGAAIGIVESFEDCESQERIVGARTPREVGDARSGHARGMQLRRPLSNTPTILRSRLDGADGGNVGGQDRREQGEGFARQRAS